VIPVGLNPLADSCPGPERGSWFEVSLTARPRDADAKDEAPATPGPRLSLCTPEGRSYACRKARERHLCLKRQDEGDCDTDSHEPVNDRPSGPRHPALGTIENLHGLTDVVRMAPAAMGHCAEDVTRLRAAIDRSQTGRKVV